MPQEAICEGCGAVLYKGIDLKPPDEIIQRLEGKCPKCGRKLSFLPIKVEVKPVK